MDVVGNASFFSSQFFPSLSFPSAAHGDQRVRNNRTCWQLISPEKILGGLGGDKSERETERVTPRVGGCQTQNVCDLTR